MNFTAHLEEQFSWLLTMAQTKGWESYARRRAKELQASDPMYAGFWPRLAQAMGWSVTTDPADSSPATSSASR
jgi:hypothetical protein